MRLWSPRVAFLVWQTDGRLLRDVWVPCLQNLRVHGRIGRGTLQVALSSAS